MVMDTVAVFGDRVYGIKKCCFIATRMLRIIWSFYYGLYGYSIVNWITHTTKFKHTHFRSRESLYQQMERFMLLSKRWDLIKWPVRWNRCCTIWFIHFQAQYSENGPAPKLFEEDETYWEPAADACGLYRQLSSKKYREIVRRQIQYEKELVYWYGIIVAPLYTGLWVILAVASLVQWVRVSGRVQ